MTSLPSMDRRGRLERLRNQLRQPGPLAECDALWATDANSLRYLCGFTGSAGQLWIDGGVALLLTDSRYALAAEAEVSAAGVDDLVDVFIGGPDEQRTKLADLASTVEALGVEADNLSWAAARRLEGQLQPTTLVATSGVVAALREVKDAGEVARIRAAAAIADAALASRLHRLVSGCTELEFARQLDYEMVTNGATAPSFPTICAAGPNSALPHARPSDRPIEPGDLVVVDFGAIVDGYHSDMTRTFAVGNPDSEAAQMLAAVTEAQQLGVATVMPGAPCAAVDDACRNHLDGLGMGHEFTHGTGHGVGLDIHEAPWVGASSEQKLVEGQVLTVEPGVYRQHVGGVRVEDTVLVTPDGAHPLTLAPKEPII